MSRAIEKRMKETRRADKRGTASQRVKFRFEVGDTVSAQGARLTVLTRFIGPDGRPAYQMISPFTTGEPWNVSESFLSTSRKVRTRK